MLFGGQLLFKVRVLLLLTVMRTLKQEEAYWLTPILTCYEASVGSHTFHCHSHKAERKALSYVTGVQRVILLLGDHMDNVMGNHML